MMESIKAGTKRPHSSLEDAPIKRRRVHHRLQHHQRKPVHLEPATQTPVFAQGQLLRSLSAALATVGFDSVKPTALEMFRAATEEYMLQFLKYVRISMQSARRTSPTAADFIAALALIPNCSRASLLNPQLKLPIPEEISYPSIADPDPPLEVAPDFTSLLAPLISKETPAYIPSHFPRLPPHHAWKSTAVFPEREVDARKMREKAIEEGLLAENALRRLAAAAKTGAARAEKRRVAALSGPGKSRGTTQGGGGNKGGNIREEADAEKMFAEILQQVGGKEAGNDDEMELGLGLDRGRDSRADGVDLDMPDGVVVNYGISGWRHSARKGLRL